MLTKQQENIGFFPGTGETVTIDKTTVDPILNSSLPNKNSEMPSGGVFSPKINLLSINIFFT